jgi:hypothetical protein
MNTRLSFFLLLVFLPVAAFSQQVRIGQLGLAGWAAAGGTYPALSREVARFDVVATDGVKDPGQLEKLIGGLDEGWGAAISRNGGFGFVYSERIELLRDLGSYPGKSQRGRPPYGAQFRLPGTRFAFNLVVCSVDGASLLGSVHRYYEQLTGNKGITLLLNAESRETRPADRLFFSPALKPRIKESGVLSTALHPAYVILNSRG